MKELILLIGVLMLSVFVSGESHFAFGAVGEAYEEAASIGVFWSRPHPGPFIWGYIEQEEGTYNWTEVDEYVMEAQSYGFDLLVTIWPFADWDQQKCHSYSECEGAGFEPDPWDEGGIPMWRCMPCNLTAYGNFVRAMVERYDHDGINDMENLSRGIRFWEASNEPSMQEDSLIFFKGSSEEYLDLLNSTYQAVKEADSNASILHAGMAGLSDYDDDVRDFWNPIYSRASEFFDVANIHSIGTGGEHLWIAEMNEFMHEHGVNKTLWVTEVQYSSDGLGREIDSLTDEEWAETIVRSFVYALGNGADRLFYVALQGDPNEDGPELMEKDKTKKPAYHAFGTMVEQIDHFDTAIKKDNSTYTFTVNDGQVFALWGSGGIPTSLNLTGNVTVTDIYGNEQNIDASEISLTDSPVFINQEMITTTSTTSSTSTTTLTGTTTSSTTSTTTLTGTTSSTTSSTTTTMDMEEDEWDVCELFGDYPPCDGTVDDFELLEHIGYWVQGFVSDFNLLTAIDNWVGD